jgi:hypothetical protein
MVVLPFVKQIMERWQTSQPDGSLCHVYMCTTFRQNVIFRDKFFENFNLSLTHINLMKLTFECQVKIVINYMTIVAAQTYKSLD